MENSFIPIEMLYKHRTSLFCKLIDFLSYLLIGFLLLWCTAVSCSSLARLIGKQPWFKVFWVRDATLLRVSAPVMTSPNHSVVLLTKLQHLMASFLQFVELSWATILLLWDLKRYLYIFIAILQACAAQITPSSLLKSYIQWPDKARWLND